VPAVVPNINSIVYCNSYNRIDDNYDLVICNLFLANKCPLKCSFYFQPSRNRTVVDCSGLNITVLKNTMPDFDNLEIDLFSNNIGQNIVKHDYFLRVTKFNLANNSLPNQYSTNI
jgi:hypothetical protein